MPGSKDILERVRNDRKLLSAHRITEAELDFLAKVDLFGNLRSIDDMLLILRNIRQTRDDKRRA